MGGGRHYDVEARFGPQPRGIKCLRQKDAGASLTAGGQGATEGTLSLGVVGCARILPAHLRGILAMKAGGFDLLRVTALCARRADDAAMFRRRGEGPPPRPPASTNEADPLGAPHLYVSDIHAGVVPEIFEDWHDMFAGDLVDAVLVLAPVSLHHQVALDALAAGKHVIIEKPFAISVKAGQAIAKEARRRGLVAGVAESARYAPRPGPSNGPSTRTSSDVLNCGFRPVSEGSGPPTVSWPTRPGGTASSKAGEGPR